MVGIVKSRHTTNSRRQYNKLIKYIAYIFGQCNRHISGRDDGDAEDHRENCCFHDEETEQTEKR